MAPFPPFADSPGLDVAAASATIRRICGWHIWPRLTQEITINEPGGGRDLFLPTLLLHEITACTVEGIELTEDEIAGLEWSGDGYLGRGSGVQSGSDWVSSGGAWPFKRRSVVITIVHGYDDRPADLAQLCLQMAGRATLAPAGRILTSQSAGGRSESYAVTPYESELECLDQYRLR